MPWAMTSSSSMIRTFGTRASCVRNGLSRGEGVVTKWSMQTPCGARCCSRRAARRSSSSTRTASCVAASRRARQSLGVREGDELSSDLLHGERALVVPYAVDGRQERLVYLSEAGDLAAYEELRSGFTAAVSHELRTPLARLLSLLELAACPGRTCPSSSSRRAREVDQIRELIDEVLFLAELESGHACRLARRRAGAAGARGGRGRARGAGRAGRRRARTSRATRTRPPRCGRGCCASSPGTWPRTRSATPGPGANATLSVQRDGRRGVVIRVVDDGAGVDQADLPRLFERFYRADRARASRGTGLGLAIVKHVVTSAGGTVEAHGGRGRGLEIRCSFPARAVAPFTTLSPDLHHPAPPAAAGALEDSRA